MPLEVFTNQLQQITNGYLTRQREEKILQRNEEVARRVAKAVLKSEEIRKERERQAFLRVRKREALKVLDDFQVEERLDRIKRIVWQGKGVIKPIPDEELRGRHSGYDWLRQMCGLQLTHKYPTCRIDTRYYSPEVGGSYSVDTFVPYMGATRLYIVVTDLEGASKNEIESLEISSGTYSETERRGYKFTNFLEKSVPVKAPDSIILLDQILLEESNIRVNNQFLPPQLESRAKREIQEARKKCMAK